MPVVAQPAPAGFVTTSEESVPFLDFHHTPQPRQVRVHACAGGRHRACHTPSTPDCAAGACTADCHRRAVSRHLLPCESAVGPRPRRPLGRLLQPKPARGRGVQPEPLVPVAARLRSRHVQSPPHGCRDPDAPTDLHAAARDGIRRAHEHVALVDLVQGHARDARRPARGVLQVQSRRDGQRHLPRDAHPGRSLRNPRAGRRAEHGFKRRRARRFSDDGLTIWFGSDRGGDMDIYTATRPDRSSPWTAPVVVPELSSPQFDDGITISSSQLVAYLPRIAQGTMKIFRATRPTVAAPWSTPVSVDEARQRSRESVGERRRLHDLLRSVRPRWRRRICSSRCDPRRSGAVRCATATGTARQQRGRGRSVAVARPALHHLRLGPRPGLGYAYDIYESTR